MIVRQERPNKANARQGVFHHFLILTFDSLVNQACRGASLLEQVIEQCCAEVPCISSGHIILFALRCTSFSNSLSLSLFSFIVLIRGFVGFHGVYTC